MLKNLYFLKSYNDYFNREIKYQSSVEDYTEAVESYTLIPNYNFYINDNVNASIKVLESPYDANSEGMEKGVWRHGTYLLVQDTQDPSDITRWFITEAKYIRQGQCLLTLRRDLVADFLTPLLKSTVYVEKGYIRNNTTSIANYNPFAFSQEGFSANQIKKSETALKDKAGCKWVVGYLNKGAYTAETQVKTYSNESLTPNYSYASITGTFLEKFIDPTTLQPKSNRCYVKGLEAEIDIHYYAQAQTGGEYWRHTVGRDSVSKTKIDASSYRGKVTCNYSPSLPISLSSTAYGAPAGNYEDMVTTLVESYDYFMKQTDWEEGLTTNGKILYISSTDKYYRIKVDKTRASTSFLKVSPNGPSAANYTRLRRYVTTGAQPCNTPPASDENFRLNVYLSEKITVQLIEERNDGYTLTIDPQTYNKTINEAFDVFAIPLLEDYCRFSFGNTTYFSSDYNSALAMGQELTDVTNQALDLQLLPYAPIPDSWIDFYTVTAEDVENNNILTEALIGKTILEFKPEGSQKHEFEVITAEDTNINLNMIFFLSSAQFSKEISFTDTNDYSSIENVKCVNQLDTWRLYSGDYSSSFEFNMARNGGVTYFEVDCAYKPYHPYIRIAPDFGGLYGSDFNDTRGLVCSNTDYSLPRISSPWETYERTNINYMNAFNRQIQNMDVNRKYQKVSEQAQVIAGALSGGASGGAIGSIGGKAGAAIGGAIGGIASLGAGLQDLWVSEQLYKENKQYTIDQFNMNLENIQALPNTATAIGALNPNNKVFPQLTYYSCSQEEKDAFLLKMKWDGMTIGILTNKISDYVNIEDKTYFKGRLVYMPLEDVDIDSHELAELADELAKGILIDKGVIN